jgi:hypothetical protein
MATKPNTTKATTKATTTKATHAVSGKASDTKASLVTSAVLTSTAVAMTRFESTESKATKAIADTEWRQFGILVDAYVTLGTDFLATWRPLCTKAKVKVTADAIHTAITKRGGALYVESAERVNIPNKSRLGRALSFADAHNADRFAAFKASGNAPKLTDYAPYLARVSGNASDTNTKIDVAKSLAAGADAVKASGAKVDARLAFKVTRKPVARTDAAASPVVSSVDPAAATWGVMATKSDDELRATPIAMDFSQVDPALFPAVARQLLAAIILAERAKPAIPAAPAVVIATA